MPADLVVLATGYMNMSEWVGLFCGTEVEAKVGHVGGYGSGTKDDPGPYLGEVRRCEVLHGERSDEALVLQHPPLRTDKALTNTLTLPAQEPVGRHVAGGLVDLLRQLHAVQILLSCHCRAHTDRASGGVGRCKGSHRRVGEEETQTFWSFQKRAKYKFFNYSRVYHKPEGQAARSGTGP